MRSESKVMERTLDEGCFEVGRPYDLDLALDCLPAFSACDNCLDCVAGVCRDASLGDGVGDVVHGGDTDVVGHVWTLRGH